MAHKQGKIRNSILKLTAAIDLSEVSKSALRIPVELSTHMTPKNLISICFATHLCKKAPQLWYTTPDG